MHLEVDALLINSTDSSQGIAGIEIKDTFIYSQVIHNMFLNKSEIFYAYICKSYNHLCKTHLYLSSPTPLLKLAYSA